MIFIPLLVTLLLAGVSTASYAHFPLSKEIPTKLSRRGTGVTPIFRDEPDTPWYFITVNIGDSPSQNLKLALDSGGELWVPALNVTMSQCPNYYPQTQCDYAEISGLYDPNLSKSFENITSFRSLYIDYGSSTVTGTYGRDTVKLNQITVKNQTIGLATNFSASPSIGVQPSRLGEGHSSFLENLEAQDQINSLVTSIYLGDIASGSGDLYFGAIDESRFCGELHAIDNRVRMSVGEVMVEAVYWNGTDGTNEMIAGPSASGLRYDVPGDVRIGATSIGAPADVYRYIVRKLDSKLTRTRSLMIQSCAEVNDLGSVIFTISGRNYSIDTRQMFSNEFFEPLGDFDCWRYLTIVSLDRNPEVFVLGEPFIRSTYIVYDYTNNQTLLAPASLNATGDQVIKEVGMGGAKVSGEGSPCPASTTETITPTSTTPPPPTDGPSTPIGAIVGGAVGGGAALILGGILVWWIKRKWPGKRDPTAAIEAPAPPAPAPDIDMAAKAGGPIIVTSTAHGNADSAFAPIIRKATVRHEMESPSSPVPSYQNTAFDFRGPQNGGVSELPDNNWR